MGVSLVDREGDVIFPLLPRAQQRRDSLLVSDFMRFPAPWTRSELTPRGAVLASIAPVRQPDWGVLVERDRDLAFASVDLMVRDTVIWSAVALAAALLLGLFFARGLSTPIARLAQSTHAISEGEYGATVKVGGTAEIADLSESFNRMSASIRTAFDQVQRAARENRELFLASVRALAEAIDAKDPYTRGHSERVAAYAATIAAEMGPPPAGGRARPPLGAAPRRRQDRRGRPHHPKADGPDGGRVPDHEDAPDQGGRDHGGHSAARRRHPGHEIPP